MFIRDKCPITHFVFNCSLVIFAFIYECLFFVPVSKKFFNSLICQRMFNKLLQHFKRNRCNMCTVHCSIRSEEHTSELQSRGHLVCRLLLEKKKQKNKTPTP